MTNEMWLGVARHILTVIGGGFVAKGYLDANSLNVVVGAATSLAGVGLSIWNKRASK
jgi:hypothetical protein